jgi:hypothetical protein
MARSAINVGFPNPNYVIELGKRDAILPGTYEIEQGALSATSSATIGNLTLAAAAAAIDSAALARTIAALTLAATGTGTVSSSLSATLADLTLAATATVTDSASLTATIDPITLAATAAVIDSASLDATIGPITLVATGQDVISAVVDATLGAITLAATGTAAAARSRDGVFPWWWRAYCERIYAERRAAEEEARRERELWLAENAIDGDGYVVGPVPVAHGEAEHIPPPESDEIAALMAVWLLFTGDRDDGLAGDVEFWDPGEAAPAHADDEAAIASAMSFLLHAKEFENA